MNRATLALLPKHIFYTVAKALTLCVFAALDR